MTKQTPHANSPENVKKSVKSISKQTGQFDIRNAKKMCICNHSLAVHAPRQDINGNRPCEVTKHFPGLKHVLPGGKCDCPKFVEKKRVR